MPTETIPYRIGELTFQGHAVYSGDGQQKRPGVLVAHAWMGQDDFARQKAAALAEMGYVGFAADLYGNGIHVTTPEEATELMAPLFSDRKVLRQRIVAAYETLKMHPLVDSSCIGAIGFCFGGLTVTELLRSGVPLKAVISFHGLMGTTLGALQAVTEPSAEKMQGAFLALHGHDDPLVAPEAIAALEKELTAAGVDWQLHVYGHTQHAFTNPQAHDPQRGLMYNAKAERRAWHAMRQLFQETFIDE